MINRRGFTLVELIIVIIVIAVLASIAILGLDRYIAEGRDNQRASNATAISEALEKFYDQNGEYPSCGAMTGSGSSVTTNVLKGLDQSALLVPDVAQTVTNSIQCAPTLMPGNSSGDYFQYVGDGSADCSGSGSCLSYTLRYRDENDGTVLEIKSRHTTDIATSGDAILKATVDGFTGINLVWNKVQNATGYTLQQSTSNDFSTNLVTTAPSTNNSNVTGLTPGTDYYYRVRPEGTGQAGNWSNVAMATTLELGTPVLTGTVNSSTQITTTWTTADNADATTKYTIQMASDSGFTTGVVTKANLTTTSYVWTGLSVGQSYYFRVQAVATGDTSDWSNIAATVTIPSAPTGVSLAVNSATQYTISWTASDGASSYTVRYGTNSSANTYSVSTTSTSVAISANILQGTTHYFKVYAVTSGGLESAASATVSGTTPINAPPAFSITGSNNGTALTASATAASCPSGTTRYFLWKANGSTWVQGTGYPSVTYSLSPGQGVTLTASVKCQKGSVESSYRNASNSVSFTRPGMNLSLSTGADECVGGYCGRVVNANWNNICGTGAPTITGKELSAVSSWTADTASSDSIHWKGASSPGVQVTYTVPIGCTTGTASINVISAYKCTGCS